jgi:hypothetical protein
MDTLFSKAAAPAEPEDGTSSPAVRVIAERMSADGIRMEYRIECPPEALSTLQGSSSLQVTRAEDGTVEVLVLDGREIGDILNEIGLGPK